MDTLPAAADAMVWRTVAAGVLVLPAPTSVTTHDTAGRRHLVLNVPTAADAAAWADWLGLADAETQVFDPYTGQSGTQRPGFTDYSGYRSGWRWTIRGQGQPSTEKPLTDPVDDLGILDEVDPLGYANEPGPAESPRELITDPVELAAAYDMPWPADACPSCGGPIYDGQCYGAEQCQDPKCTRACCASKRQGPVAVQQPGTGAS